MNAKAAEEVLNAPARVRGQSGQLARRLRAFLGLTQEELAHLLGVRVRTVARWESGATEPNAAAREKMEYLEQLAATLETVMERHHVARWLETPNPELLGQPPIDLVQSRYGRRVLEQEIERAQWGIPG
ncbi:MAG TPA: helix-turn-helix domain-containing protein [Acidobacteria bacterium]|nr:helix-turn-helix domain-containing protein [Acidobacteriota bacterium]